MGKSKWDLLSLGTRLMGSKPSPIGEALKRGLSTSAPAPTSSAAAAEQPTSAYSYLNTFSDYQAPYLPWINKHAIHFEQTSVRFDAYVAAKKINTNDLSALRQAYKAMATEQNQYNQVYCTKHKVCVDDQQCVSYLGRLALQFATRAFTFKADPLAIHRIHASLCAKGYPALGRLPEHINDPTASAARTRSDADLKATIKIKPKKAEPGITFFADDKGTKVTVESTASSTKPTS